MKREFQQTEAKKVSFNDLTYVKVNNIWHCVYIFANLLNYETIFFSPELPKDADPVTWFFSSIQGDP